LRHRCISESFSGNHRRDDLLGEAVHLLRLRAHLQQQQAEPGFLIFGDPLLDLLGRADQVGAQAAVGDGIFLQLELALELGARQPLVEIVEAGGRARRHLR
jgi:hypothetical protein